MDNYIESGSEARNMGVEDPYFSAILGVKILMWVFWGTLVEEVQVQKITKEITSK